MKLTPACLVLVLGVVPMLAVDPIPSDRDPRITYSINPNVTYSINPNVTPSLNPTKAKWSGYFIFNKDLSLVGIAVRANPDILLLFNNKVEWIGYFVRAENNFNLFDLDGKWTGFLSGNSNGAYNYFTIHGEWLWFLT